jgi:hypothetical protein
MTAEEIVDAFGGTSKLATALNVPTSTVHSWRENDFIPEWRQPRIVALALERKVALAATDFPPKKPRASAEQAAA